MRAVGHLVAAVVERSGGRCEAVWSPGYRCRNPADEIQHRLPRSRARLGDEHLLDLWALHDGGDVDHLAHLCKPCHDEAHANTIRAEEAMLVGPFGSTHPSDCRVGIVIRGSISRRADGRLVYAGPSSEFLARFPR